VIFSWLLFGFWSLVWVFQLFHFFFSFSLDWLLVCVVNALIKGGGIKERSVKGPVDGLSRLWWVIDSMVWTDSWPSIAGAGCGLICISAGEERSWKVYALRDLQGVERQIGLTRGTRWPAGSSAGRMVVRKEKWSRWSEPVQGSGSNWSLYAGFAAVHHKTGGVTWLTHKTKTEGSAGGDGILVRREASMPATRGGIAGLASGGEHHVWFEDRWMVASLCDEWLTMLCGLIIG
jgi:hypothetical protein